MRLSLLLLPVLLSACAGTPARPTVPDAPEIMDGDIDFRGDPQTVADLCDRLRPGLAGEPSQISRYASAQVIGELVAWGDADAELVSDEDLMRCYFESGDAALAIAVDRRVQNGPLVATEAFGGPVGDHRTPGSMGLVGEWQRSARAGDIIRITETDDGMRLSHHFARTIGGDPALGGPVSIVDACPDGRPSLYGSLVIDGDDGAICYRIDAFEPGARLAYTHEANATTWEWRWMAP